MHRYQLLALIGILCVAGCQQAPVFVNTGQENKGLAVSGTATVRATPTLVVLRLGCEFSERQPVAAKRKAEVAIRAVIGAIRKQGIAAEDVQTTDFSLSSTYSDLRKAVVWNCSSMLEVRVKQIDKADPTLMAALAAGANQVRDIEYTIEELQELRAKARDQACGVAKKKAEQYARNFGFGLGKPKSINEGYPGNWDYGRNTMTQNVRFSSVGGSSGRPESVLSSGSVAVQLTVNVEYEID